MFSQLIIYCANLYLFFRVLTQKSHSSTQLSLTLCVMSFSSVSGVKALLKGIANSSPQRIPVQLQVSQSFHLQWWLWLLLL